MNLFVLGWTARGGAEVEVARAAVRSFLSETPFLGGRPVRSWTSPTGRAVAAWVTHDPDDVGHVDYVHAEERRLALFSGRPVRWLDDHAADGRGPLDARRYLPPSREWAEALDGRMAVVRYDDDPEELEIVTDPLGAYPVYRCAAVSGTWFANNAEVLRRIAGSTELDVEAVASVLGAGWPVAGHPIWRAVRRLPRGAVVQLSEGQPETVRSLLPDDRIAGSFRGGPFDADAAARTLTGAVAALADWPGRPSEVQVTGGRDSRVVLAAARRAGIGAQAVTGGSREHPDFVIGRALAQRAGMAHAQMPSDPHGDVFRDPWATARLTALLAAGTATAADGAGFPHGPRPGPLVLAHSGQGGEIARRYYGGAATTERLYGALVARRPWRPELLGDAGRALLMGQLTDWAAAQGRAGLAREALPDAFYLLVRMGAWSGPGHGMVEWIRDTTSPLWSVRMLPHLLALPPRERARGAFHRAMVERLAPELLDVPFEDGGGWETHSTATAVRRLRRAGAKVARVLARRGGPLLASARVSRGRPAPATAAEPSRPDPMTELAAHVGRWVRDRQDHPAVAPLDVPRTLALLARPVASHDVIERYQVLRLATVVAACDGAEARVATTIGR